MSDTIPQNLTVPIDEYFRLASERDRLRADNAALLKDAERAAIAFDATALTLRRAKAALELDVTHMSNTRAGQQRRAEIAETKLSDAKRDLDALREAAGKVQQAALFDDGYALVSAKALDALRALLEKP